VPDGDHRVTIRVQYNATYQRGILTVEPREQVSLPISFSVSISVVFPNVTVFSLQPLDSSDVVVRFMVDKPVESVSYSLDGESHVNVDTGILVEYSYGSRAFWRGNLTLTELTVGTHNLTVYATDAAGNTGNATVTFTVEAATEQEPQPFPTIPVATSIPEPAVIRIGVGLLVHFNKRNH